MASPNLLTLDDFLLKGSVTSAILVVIAGFLGWQLPSELRGSDLSFFLSVGFSALAPVAMAIMGFALRERERRALALMKLVDRQVELVAEDLLANSEFTRSTLALAIRDLNSSGVRHVVWDHREGLIQDGRLRQSRLHIETCPSCGVKISVDVALHGAAAVHCPSCDSTLDAREIDEEKQAVIADLADRAVPRTLRVELPTSRFSWPLFTVLLVVFWPVALLYALRHWKLPPCPADEAI